MGSLRPFLSSFRDSLLVTATLFIVPQKNIEFCQQM